jgi:hypothetical protein
LVSTDPCFTCFPLILKEKVAVEQRQLQEEIKKQEEHALKIKEEERILNEKLAKMEVRSAVAFIHAYVWVSF